MTTGSALYRALKSLFSGGYGLFQKNIPKDSIIVNNIMVRPATRQTQDIQKWRNALIEAEGVFQQRKNLYDLYTDILLDGFLVSTIEKRIGAVTNCELSFTVNGKPVDQVVALTYKSFFETFLREVMLARFWGHSLLELHWEKEQAQTILIPRKHVKPRFQIVTKHEWDIEGMEYAADPFRHRIIEVGDPESLGRLLQCAPYVIYKRGNFGDWAEYAEIFGTPFRWATYNNEQSRTILEAALEQAGSAGYVVAPEDAKIQFLNSAQGSQNSDIFRFLRESCNEELAITVLGNTETTTSSRRSGYAQAETHMTGQNELHKDDRRYVLRILNEKLTPYLESIGMQVAGGIWDFVDDDQLSLTERLNIDTRIAAIVPIPDEYWYEKYHLPKPDNEEEVDDPEEEEEDKPAEKKKPGKEKS